MTVPMIDAMARNDSRLIAKRIDDTSSTVSASHRRSVFISIPVVLVFIFSMLTCQNQASFEKQKGRPWPPLPYPVLQFLDYFFEYLKPAILSQACNIICDRLD